MLPILKSLLRSSGGPILAAVQVAVTLAVCSNAAFIVNNRITQITEDKGIDTDKIIAYSARGFGDDFDHLQTVERDLRVLRSLPGVLSASYTSSIPLSQAGGSNGWSGSDLPNAPRAGAAYFHVSEEIVETLGLNIVSGRSFTVNDMTYGEPGSTIKPKHALITQALAEDLFPNKPAVGELVYDVGGDSREVIGVVERLHGPFVDWEHNQNSILQPVIYAAGRIRYLVRAEPDYHDRLIPEIEKALHQQDRNKVLVYLGPLTQVAARSFEEDRAVVIALTTSIILILLVTAFGLVGLASSSVSQRTKQIGIRRALGARKVDILTYFITENWLTTTAGVMLGLLLTQMLNYLFVTNFQLEPLDTNYVILGVFAVWLLGLLAVIGPALRAVHIPPALATRTV